MTIATLSRLAVTAAKPTASPAPTVGATSKSPVKTDTYEAPKTSARTLDLRARTAPPTSSEHVRIVGDSAAHQLDGPASKDAVGPMAKLRGRIRALTDHTERAIRADEARMKQLPAGSPQRAALRKKIDAQVRAFRGEVATSIDRTRQQVSPSDKGALDRLKSRLPGFAQKTVKYGEEAAKKGGLHIPGVPGAIVPRVDNGAAKGPSGADYKLKF